MSSLLSNLFSGIAKLAIDALNGLIAALASVIGALFTALPDMPALPSPPAAMVAAEGWVAWVFPVGFLLTTLGWVLTVWLLWQAVAIGLRWAKMISADS